MEPRRLEAVWARPGILSRGAKVIKSGDVNKVLLNKQTAATCADVALIAPTKSFPPRLGYTL